MNSSINTQQTHLRKTNIRDLVNQLQKKGNIQLASNFPKLIIDPQSITLRKSWKDGGYGNKPFSDIFPIKAKILSGWEIERIPLSKRSYSCPKNFKGYKFDGCSRPFDIKKQEELHSLNFNKYLTKIKQKYQKIVYLPKPTEIINKIQKIKSLSSTGMKFKSTTSFFGSPTIQKKGQNRIKSYRSQTLSKPSFFS